MIVASRRQQANARIDVHRDPRPGRDGRSRPQYVSLPLVTSLLEENLKYFVLPPDDEPAPAVEGTEPPAP